MPHLRLVYVSLPLVLLGAAALGSTAHAQAAPTTPPATRLELSQAPEAARNEFQAAVTELTMGNIAGVVPHLDEALKLDEGFGMARTLRALWAPMAMPDRTKELDRGVADALRGGTREATVALALRSARLSEAQDAPALLRAATEYFPEDQLVAWLSTARPGVGGYSTPHHRTIAVQELSEKHPDWAFPQLMLATDLYNGGDRAGGITAAARGIELAPSHPQPHLTYGNLLRNEGRYEEALAHYRHFTARGGAAATARTQIVTTLQLQGQGAAARKEIAAQIAEANTPVERILAHRLDGMSWALDGNLKMAEAAALQAVAAGGEATPPLNTVQAHVELALFSALAGNRRGVTSHLDAGAATNAGALAQHAMILAAAGMNAEATAAVDSALKRAGASPNALLQSRVALARALVQLNAKNAEAALTEADHAQATTPMTAAVMALAEQMSGRTAAAKIHRARVMAWPNFQMTNLEHVLARVLAQRVE